MKEQLLAYCKNQVQERVERIRQEISHAQETANDDTKSSAGDKYETGRAMMHLQQEQSRGKLNEALKLIETLSKVPVNTDEEIVSFGSLVKSSTGWFFLSVSLGKVNMDGNTYFLISTASPMGKALLGKRVGDQVAVNGRNMEIMGIE